MPRCVKPRVAGRGGPRREWEDDGARNALVVAAADLSPLCCLEAPGTWVAEVANNALLKHERRTVAVTKTRRWL